VLDGDTYHLSTQMNSTLGRETAPKHGGRGAIYVPEPAVQIIERLPPRLQDDLLFHTKTGRQFRQESWWRTWDPIRTRLARELPAGHHLRQRLAQDPDDKLDFHELRHMGASYALNILEIEPWVIAKQLRHSDDGALVIKLYGHPTRQTAMDRMRRGWGANVRQLPVRPTDACERSREIPEKPA
jgi:integrase